MKKILLSILVILLVPTSVLGARASSSFLAGSSLLASSSSPGNAYAAGVSAVLTAPVIGDFASVAGSIITAAPIGGDALLFAGSVHTRASITGDLRAVGGSVVIEDAVGGDIMAFGYSVTDTGKASGNVFVIAANTSLAGGAAGPVTIYGNNIALDGVFSGDVTITASGHITLAPTAVIHGKLVYEAPEPAVIPEQAVVDGGVQYTSASYLPDVGTSRFLALVSVSFFLLVRILGALILAGLLAGLFPRFATAVVSRAYDHGPRSVLLTMLLGFGILVATPILLLLLSLTFVGLGLAFLLGILYVLLVLLAVVYAGIVLGSLFARRFAHRETILWRDGVLGMLVLSFITLVPVIGSSAVLLLTIFAMGALLQIFFQFAFPHEELAGEML